MKMGILNMLLGRKNINDISMEELENEKIRLTVEEKNLLSKKDKIIEIAEKLLQEDAKAISEMEKKVIKRKLSEKDNEIKDIKEKLEEISQKISVVDAFIRLKKEEKKLIEKGLWQVISKMSMRELEDTLVKKEIKDEERSDMLKDILSIVGKR
ncbi:MAG: hypothetical protein GW779_07155 [Candidatus Altiarchaeum hamiconexum]|uniref:Uncharacterized protein n=1 Tax=Candidatus Altarchaeum hamiconexum TaxID=1803513 RepID=A0A8J7YTD3_9ARCH|nr:hypothetical protein [Candidatus Altarchaeum hamiconexum]PIV27105.1 MAG: hypothetical protein COS36_06905 [Candidatus Altarchaeum sp. CG03_land_8_20_14_0_80_32_618]PJC13129.1 MAG: hypothetical protein CO063_04705 [Candidatus Altarchaeum sp. CG_4_9_14_0_8_um_filter_32_206]NCN69505.1 hypothetical protein [Candidatus Altarchaeum hamiconexum]NCS92156.1 hypothetical protein [Candidatus Altarchaeum hamiconexum]